MYAKMFSNETHNRVLQNQTHILPHHALNQRHISTDSSHYHHQQELWNPSLPPQSSGSSFSAYMSNRLPDKGHH